MDKRQLRIVVITIGTIFLLPIIIYILIKKPIILIGLAIVLAALGYEWLRNKGIA